MDSLGANRLIMVDPDWCVTSISFVMRRGNEGIFSHFPIATLSVVEIIGIQLQICRQWQESIERGRKKSASFIGASRQVRSSYYSDFVFIALDDE